MLPYSVFLFGNIEVSLFFLKDISKWSLSVHMMHDTSHRTSFYRELETLVTDAEDRLRLRKCLLYTFIEPSDIFFVS